MTDGSHPGAPVLIFSQISFISYHWLINHKGHLSQTPATWAPGSWLHSPCPGAMLAFEAPGGEGDGGSPTPLLSLRAACLMGRLHEDLWGLDTETGLGDAGEGPQVPARGQGPRTTVWHHEAETTVVQARRSDWAPYVLPGQIGPKSPAQGAGGAEPDPTGTKGNMGDVTQAQLAGSPTQGYDPLAAQPHSSYFPPSLLPALLA